MIISKNWLIRRRQLKLSITLLYKKLSESPPAMIAAPAMPVEHNVYEPHRSDVRQLVADKMQELTDEAFVCCCSSTSHETEVPNLRLLKYSTRKKSLQQRKLRSLLTRNGTSSQKRRFGIKSERKNADVR